MYLPITYIRQLPISENIMINYNYNNIIMIKAVFDIRNFIIKLLV